jgi:rhamnosyltransferase
LQSSISIVIPVRNEAKGIKACLESWLSQTVTVNEVVVIDSGSTDGTLEIVRGYGKIRLVEIPSSEFNHGTTRNRAMQHVSGELTLMTVGDGRAADSTVLARMQNHFAEASVAGVCGLQIVPHELDKNPIEWFRPQSAPQVKSFRFASPQQFDLLEPDHKREAASWDDVIAMYRTSVLRDQIPFREITYGEDPFWAVDALKSGHKLVYDPSARVYHYHLENADVTYKRAITMLCLRKWLFGVRPAPPKISVRSRLSMIRTLIKIRPLSLSKRLDWYAYNTANQKALRQAVTDFLEAEQRGEDAVRELHDRCAGKPFKVLSVV